MTVFVCLLWTGPRCFQGRSLAAADSDVDQPSEVEEEQEFPAVGSGSESSTYGLTKKKKRRPKEKKEKSPRKKRDDDEDDDDQDEDGTMKVSVGFAQRDTVPLSQARLKQTRSFHPHCHSVTTKTIKCDLKGWR